jgi:hypothetical protein
MSAEIEVRLLGPLEVCVCGESVELTPGQGKLLTVLALRAPDGV